MSKRKLFPEDTGGLEGEKLDMKPSKQGQSASLLQPSTACIEWWLELMLKGQILLPTSFVAEPSVQLNV